MFAKRQSGNLLLYHSVVTPRSTNVGNKKVVNKYWQEHIYNLLVYTHRKHEFYMLTRKGNWGRDV